MKEKLLEKIEQLNEQKQAEVLAYVESILQESSTSNTRSKRKAGSMKGLIQYMANDFDAPLEDFKEYM